jgi:3-hydroxybutyryl-CoA dehydrogenase
MKNISVMGCGTMGNGIAQTFAQFDYNVILYDISQDNLEKAKLTIDRNLDRMVKKEVISKEKKSDTLNKIITTTDFNLIRNSDLVIEAISENIELKKSIFSKLDLECDSNTILASNTSSISITELADSTNRKDKVIGMHFMNPVPIMKLVEIINSKYTSKSTTEKIVNLSNQLNKIPLTVNDFPGFISNRILMPMINEAIEALNDGVSEVKNIDGIMKLGMGHPMGPLQLADLIGLDVCKSILEVMYKGLNKEKYMPNPLLNDMVKKGSLGVKSGEGFYDYSESKKAEMVSKRFRND